ncbi:histidine kinase dimerization/phospho-acceptor domain-containing protein [Gilvimarinus agarilyticus]|uniref:histidine kinase dimerization/phospho-acceptor domain-containing protein n=1 Tax=Gilvimarinus agarilyticus TaxID=679259 RepID=UPI00059FB453|nr:histidine kinase dimerization/phospho-acceptor domain-containing protein [Gilvimarinus agarilyticus]
MSSDTQRLLHDVRNPLNNISVNAELGKLTLERTGDVDKASAIFERILQECRRCDTVLTELRDHMSTGQEAASENRGDNH